MMISRIFFVLLLCAALAHAETLDQAVRGYLLAAEETPPPAKPWDANGALGVTITNNGDNITVAFNIDAVKEWPIYKLSLAYRGTYEKSQGTTTQSEHIFTERLERKLNEKSSIFQDLWVENDEPVEDLSLRVYLTFGYRRKLVEKEKFTLNADIGAGVQYEDFATRTETNAIGQLGLDFEWKITKFLTFQQRFYYAPRLTDWPEYRFVSESIFITPISKRLNLRLSILDQYNSDPEPGIDANDLKFTLSLAIRFTQPPDEAEK